MKTISPEADKVLLWALQKPVSGIPSRANQPSQEIRHD